MAEDGDEIGFAFVKCDAIVRNARVLAGTDCILLDCAVVCAFNGAEENTIRSIFFVPRYIGAVVKMGWLYKICARVRDESLNSIQCLILFEGLYVRANHKFTNGK